MVVGATERFGLRGWLARCVLSVLLVVAAAGAPAASALALPPGSLDPAFGSGGIMTRQLDPSGGPGPFSHFTDVHALAGGGIVAAGTVGAFGGSGSGLSATDRFAVVRLLANGMLDAAFGSGGVAFPALPTINTVGEPTAHVAVAPDGSIVAASSTASGVVVIERLTSSGQPDPSFGTAGVISETLPTGPALILRPLVQSDGRIVLVGVTGTATNTAALLVARFLPGGSPDVSYADHGAFVRDFSNGTAQTIGVPGTGVVDGVLAGDGSVVVLGAVNATSTAPAMTVERRLVLARLSPAGTLDQSFGSGGESATVAPIYPTAIAPAPDGGFLLGGAFGLNALRVNADGTSDAGFGTDGLISPPVGTSPSQPGDASTFAVQTDGAILIAGPGFEPHGAPTVERVNGSGALDSAFGQGGLLQPVFASPSPPTSTLTEDEITSSLIDATGNLVVVGSLGGAATAARVLLDLPVPQPTTFPPGVRPLAATLRPLQGGNLGPLQAADPAAVPIGFRGAGLASAHLRLSPSGRTSVGVICPRNTAGACAGSITITGESDGSKPPATAAHLANRRLIRLAAARFTTKRGRTTAIPLRLGKRSTRMISARRLATHVLLTLATHDNTGRTATYHYSVTIRRRR